MPKAIPNLKGSKQIAYWPYSRYWGEAPVTYIVDIQCRTVQSQPRSKVKVPLDSAWVFSHSTSIDTIIVSVIFFEMIDVKFSWPSAMTRVQGVLGSKFIVTITSPLLVSYLTSFESIIVSLTFSKHLALNLNFHQDNGKVNSNYGLADMEILDFNQNNW